MCAVCGLCDRGLAIMVYVIYIPANNRAASCILRDKAVKVIDSN